MQQHGTVSWGQPIDSSGTTGVYVVALDRPTDSAPIARTPVEQLLAVRPELAVDRRRRPSVAALTARLAALWCPDETVLYVGSAGPRTSVRVSSLADRVGEYYVTPLGARSPHAGGWPLKTLGVLHELHVHYGYCGNVKRAKTAMLDTFSDAVSPSTRAALPDGLVLPFANLENGHGHQKRHGITGARAPK